MRQKLSGNLILYILKASSLAIIFVFFLTLFYSMIPIIYRGYLSDGLYNPVLLSLKGSLNCFSLLLAPVFILTSIIYWLVEKRYPAKAYLSAFMPVYIIFSVKLCYIIVHQRWFPHLWSIKGISSSILLLSFFLIAGITLFYITKNISLKSRYLYIPALITAAAILLVNILFKEMNKSFITNASGGQNRKILLIAVDAATMDLVYPFAGKGYLPNLKKLMQRGSYGRLASISPTLSPIIWTTIGTGKTKEKHGIKDFLEVDRDGEKKKTPFTSNMRKTKAIWNILSDFSKKVGVVGWWVTWPAEKVNGYMISSYVSLGRGIIKGSLNEDVPNQTYPDKLFNEIKGFISDAKREHKKNFSKIFGNVDKRGLKKDVKTAIEDTEWVLNSDEAFKNIGLYLLKNKRLDFLTVYNAGIDVVGHRFWHFMQPEGFGNLDKKEVSLFKDVIKNYYIYIDSMIGEYLKAIDDNTTVMVVSDHGMAATNGRLRLSNGAVLSGYHENTPDGLVIIAGKGIRKGYKIRDKDFILSALYGHRVSNDVYDITPTLLYLLGIPVAADMDGEIMTEIIEREYLEKNSIKYIDTYDIKGRDKKGKEALATPLDEELKKRLKALGYIN